MSASLTSITVIYAIGNLASKLISFVLVFFTTYYLTKAELGTYDLILTTVALATPILNMQLVDAVLRWLAGDKSGDKTAAVLTNSWCLVGAAFLAFTPLYWLAVPLLSIPEKLPVFLLLFSSTLLPVMQIAARGNGRNALFAVSGVVYAAVYTVGVLLLVVACHLKVVGLLYGNIVANVVTFLFIFLKGRYYDVFDLKTVDYSLCKELVFFSIPLIPNALAWWAYSSANRYLVLYFLGIEENGIWSIAYKLPTILSLFTGIFFMAWQEKAIREYHHPGRDRYFGEVLHTFVALSLGIVLVLTAAAKPVLHLIVERSFFVAWKYTVFLLLANFFQSLALFYGVGYFCVKETRQVLYTTLFGSLTTVLLGVFLIPLLGLYGAGLAAMVGFLTMFLLRLRQTRCYFRIDFPAAKCAALFACIALCAVTSYAEPLWVQLLNNACAMAIAVGANWKFLARKCAQLKPYCTRRWIHA